MTDKELLEAMIANTKIPKYTVTVLEFNEEMVKVLTEVDGQAPTVRWLKASDRLVYTPQLTERIE